MSASNFSYSPLNEVAEKDSLDIDHESQYEPNRPRTSRQNITIALLASLNVIFAVLLLSSKGIFERLPSDFARFQDLPARWHRMDWWTEYSEKNETEVNALWDAIKPSHGFVAMDEKWAADRHWPETMRLPGDQSKRVFLLEAYHQLHCLTIIRRTMLELSRGEEPNFALSHSTHCFDALRQYIQCKSDNTPLYTFGDGTAGDGQLHQCRDWDALRDFATENSACYRDSDGPIILGEHFGYCDDGDDGMRYARPANVTYSEEAWGLHRNTSTAGKR